MAESKNIVDILCRITADVKGAELTRQEIDRIKNDVEAWGKSSSDAGNAAEESFKKHWAGAVKAEEGTRGAEKATKILGKAFGEIGHLAHQFWNPVSALATTAVIAIKIFRDQLAKLNEDAKSIDIKGSLVTSIRESGEAARMAVDPWKDYAGAMNDASAAAGSVGAKLKDQIEDIERQAKAKDELVKSENAIARAQLEAKKNSGQITDEQFKKESAAMDHTAAAFALDRSTATQKAIIDAKKKALTAAEGSVNGLSRDVTDTTSRVGELEGGIKKADEIDAAYTEKRKQRSLTTQEEAARVANQNYRTSAQEELKDAKQSQALAQKAADANTKAIAQLTQEIPRMEQVLKESVESQKKVIENNRLAGAVGPATDGSLAKNIYDDAKAVAKKRASGQALSTDESQLLTTTASQIAGKGVDANTAQRMILNAEKNASVQAGFVARLLDVVEKSHANQTGVEARLRALESKVNLGPQRQ